LWYIGSLLYQKTTVTVSWWLIYHVNVPH
jgi:hypothetical protein